MHQQIVPAPAAVDASFWINAVRSGLATFLVDYFADRQQRASGLEPWTSTPASD